MFSASHSVVARISGRARPLIAGIIRPWSPPSCPIPRSCAAVREALPALAAGIYLNTGSVGPLPAETAAAMADMAAYERDVGRAHEADYRRVARRAWPRRGPGSRRCVGADVDAVALTHATTDGMNAAIAAARLARRRARRDDAPTSTPARLGPLYALRDRYGVDVDVRRRRRRRRRRPDARRVRGRDHARHPARLDLARPVDDRRGPAGRPDRRRSRTLAARWSSSTARRPPARSRSASRTSARTLYAVPAQKWLLGPEGMGALVVDPARRSSGSTPALGGWFSFERVGQRRRRRLVARCPAVRGERLPPAVGRRDGPLDRLAVDVRRARLRPPPRDRDGRRGRRPAWPPSRASPS